jgi:putative PIN family toxin of toxin-antitoxin system
MKVVIDTNVFVSSFFGGNPHKVVDLWKQGRLTLCLSKEIISEYTDVLNRMGLANQKELKEILSLFARGLHSIFAGKTPALKVVKDDPDDDKFIECAVALKANYIISGDKALREVSEYMGIKISSPKEFLNRELWEKT